MKQQKSRNNATSAHWVGIDVAKATFDAGFVHRDQRYPDTPLREIPADSFKHTSEGVKTFLAWLDVQGVEGDDVRIIMESSGGHSERLAILILEQRPALTPAIVNAYQTAKFIDSMNVRNKTDRLEARALGFYGIERNPMPYEPPTPEHAELRALSRKRDSLVDDQTKLKNQMQETSNSNTVQKMQTKQKKQLAANIKSIEQSMKKHVAQHDDLKRDIELLSSIFGIAFINAAMIIAELGDLRRFEHARQLTAFAGMSPRHRQSGTSLHGRSRLCKQGNPRVRRGLYLSAMVAIRGNNKMRETYQRLLKEGKPKMVALCAVMRKLLVLMRAILISEEPYQPMGITR